MTASTFVRRGLTAAAVATLALGATVVPATAAPQGPAQATVNAAGTGPDVQILTKGTIIYETTGNWTILPANRAVPLKLAFELGGSGKYTDVHFSTSHPGTAACDMSTIYAEVARNGRMLCPVTLPALKPGASTKYSVTMTGKRDGKAFSITRSTTVLAPNVQVSIYVDGKNVTGQRYSVPARGTSKVQYVVTNRSPQPLQALSDFMDEAPRCTIASVAPGRTGSCTFWMDRQWFAQGTQQSGSFRMWDLMGRYALTGGVFGTAPVTSIVAR